MGANWCALKPTRTANWCALKSAGTAKPVDSREPVDLRSVRAGPSPPIRELKSSCLCRDAARSAIRGPAPKERKNAAHGASRGEPRSHDEKALEGRKKLVPDVTLVTGYVVS